jgi:hypothetical protein
MHAAASSILRPPAYLLSACFLFLDVFALGMLLQAIVIGQHIRRGGQARLLPPELCPAPVARLIEACISLAAQERPSAGQVVEEIRRNMEQTHGSGTGSGSDSGAWRQSQTRDWHLDDDRTVLLQEVELCS